MRDLLRPLPDFHRRGAALSCAESQGSPQPESRQSEEKGMIRRPNAWPQVVSAFAIGLGAGAALGMLFAPQSGEDTRDYLRGTAQDSVDEAIASGKKAARRVRKHIGEATEFAN